MTNAREYVNLHRPIAEEMRSRLLHVSEVEIVDSPFDAEEPLSGIGVPGTLTVVLTRRGSGQLDLVRRAVRERGETAREYVSEIYRLTAERKGLRVAEIQDAIREDTVGSLRRLQRLSQEADDRQLSIEEATRALIDQPSFCQLRYSDFVIADHLFLPEGTDVYILTLRYTGARLRADGFRLAEYFTAEGEPSLEAVVVRAEPSLTAAELAALDALPEEIVLPDIGTDLWCDTTAWGVAAAAVGVGVAVATTYVSACPEALIAGAAAADAVYHWGAGGDLTRADIFRGSVAEEVLARLNPVASVQEIMRLREQVIRGYEYH
jgi:hypothetical protein